MVATKASTFRSGLYASIDVTSTGVAVADWYDATNQRLVYSYNTNPSGASESQWQANATVIDANFAGWFAEIHLDVNNGVHIAYYTSGTGDLKYAFLSSSNAAPQVVTVDSFLSTGTYLSLSTRLESGNVVPYIAYFTPSFVATPSSVRLAYRVNFSSLGHGAVADAYTRNWEVMTIPAINIPQEQYVGLGVPTGGTYANSIYIGYHTDLNSERAFLKR